MPRRLWGAAEALLEKIEAAAYIYAPDRSVYQGQVRAARARLDEAAWQTAWTDGRLMTPERAIEYALSEEVERESPTPVAVPEQPPPADEPTGKAHRPRARGGAPRRAGADQPTLPRSSRSLSTQSQTTCARS